MLKLHWEYGTRPLEYLADASLAAAFEANVHLAPAGFDPELVLKGLPRQDEIRSFKQLPEPKTIPISLCSIMYLIYTVIRW